MNTGSMDERLMLNNFNRMANALERIAKASERSARALEIAQFGITAEQAKAMHDSLSTDSLSTEVRSSDSPFGG
jgi:hypothetical protein